MNLAAALLGFTVTVSLTARLVAMACRAVLS
jgi:hypothetical protein